GSYNYYDKQLQLANQFGGGGRLAFSLNDNLGLEVDGNLVYPFPKTGGGPHTQVRFGSVSLVINSGGERNVLYILGGYSRLDIGVTPPYNFDTDARRSDLRAALQRLAAQVVLGRAGRPVRLQDEQRELRLRADVRRALAGDGQSDGAVPGVRAVVLPLGPARHHGRAGRHRGARQRVVQRHAPHPGGRARLPGAKAGRAVRRRRIRDDAALEPGGDVLELPGAVAVVPDAGRGQ